MTLRLRVKALIAEKNRRDGTHLSPTDVAAEIGISHNTLIAYMQHKVQRPALEVIEKLQDYFECSMDELFEKEQPLKEINRIIFAVNDIEKMVQFYNTALDANLMQIGDTPFYIGKLADIELLMCPGNIAGVRAEQNRHQFRILVQNIEQIMTAVQNAGGEQINDIQTENDARLCSIRDPEGNTMEFVEYL